MATETWTVNLDGVDHTIELEHGTLSGKRVIKLNGQVIEKSQKMMDTGTDHFFKVGDHVCAIHIRSGGFGFKYDFSIDGISTNTGQATKTLDGTPAVLVTSETAGLMEQTKYEKQLKVGANWFFWIAGLSLINTIIYLFDGSFYFVVGLGLTQIVDGIAYYTSLHLAPEAAPFLRVVGLGINLALLGILVFLGVKARNGKKWALITGLILYGLDVLIMIWAGDIFSIIFHALALFGLFQGLQAIRKIQELENKGPQRLQQF